MQKLPKRLAKEPLIDALFEMRFNATVAASSVLPGFLFGKLEGAKSVENLPTFDLPKQIRDSDPNLKFVPILRLHWNNFIIQIGDRSVAIACKLPYPGWDNFKNAILNVVGEIKGLGVINNVERYSLKYVDLLDSSKEKEQISILNLDLTVGNNKISNEHFQIRADIVRDGFVNVVQMISSAVATLADGTSKAGVIVDIDTVMDLSDEPFDDFLNKLPDRLESIHVVSKSMFFECLRPETIAALGPINE